MQAPPAYDSLLNLVRYVARGRCETIFDPHVTRIVFEHLQTNDLPRRMYLAATGCVTGMERGSHQKQVVNSSIAQAVASELMAETFGKPVPVDGAFIESYHLLKVR